MAKPGPRSSPVLRIFALMTGPRAPRLPGASLRTGHRNTEICSRHAHSLPKADVKTSKIHQQARPDKGCGTPRNATAEQRGQRLVSRGGSGKIDTPNGVQLHTRRLAARTATALRTARSGTRQAVPRDERKFGTKTAPLRRARMPWPICHCDAPELRMGVVGLPYHDGIFLRP